MSFPAEGGCSCRAVRYRMESAPMFVNCCHCTWCRRETGSAFVINAMIEADRVTLLGERPELIDTPSASGKGQHIARCPRCRVAVWSHYFQAGPRVNFMRVGTLDDPSGCVPDHHIYTSTKLPWVRLPEGAPSSPGFYDLKATWPPESLARIRATR